MQTGHHQFSIRLKRADGTKTQHLTQILQGSQFRAPVFPRDDGLPNEIIHTRAGEVFMLAGGDYYEVARLYWPVVFGATGPLVSMFVSFKDATTASVLRVAWMERGIHMAPITRGLYDRNQVKRSELSPRLTPKPSRKPTVQYARASY